MPAVLPAVGPPATPPAPTRSPPQIPPAPFSPQGSTSRAPAHPHHHMHTRNHACPPTPSYPPCPLLQTPAATPRHATPSPVRAPQAPRLRHVRLTGLTSLTASGLAAVVANPAVERVAVAGSPKLSEEDCRTLLGLYSRPGLDVLWRAEADCYILEIDSKLL